MGKPDASPDAEVTFRRSRDKPLFADVSDLPSSLTALRRTNMTSTPRPTEMSALAQRLRSIHLDISPDQTPESPVSPQRSEIVATKPLRLDFDNAQDKENVQNGVPQDTTPRSSREVKERILAGISHSPTLRTVPLAERHSGQQDITEEDKELLEKLGPSTPSGTAEQGADHSAAYDAEQIPATLPEETPDTIPEKTPATLPRELQGESDSNSFSPQNQIDKTAPLEAIESKLDEAIGVLEATATGHGREVEIEAEKTDSLHLVLASHQLSKESCETLFEHGDPDTNAAVASDVGRDSDLPTSERDRLPNIETNEATEEHNSTIPENVDDVSTSPDTDPASSSDAPIASIPEVFPEPAAPNESPVMESEPEEDASPAKACLPETAPMDTPALLSDTLPQQEASSDLEEQPNIDSETLASNVQKILDGRDKWNWPERCEAMTAVSRSLRSSKCDLQCVKDVMPTMTSRIIDNLDELRPSIITSALSLVNAIVAAKCDVGSNFAEEVFPSVLDLACGRSLTSQVAATSVAVLLNSHPSLSSGLDDADNPERLGELLESDANSSLNDDAAKARASRALDMLRNRTGTPVSLAATTASEYAPIDNDETDPSDSGKDETLVSTAAIDGDNQSQADVGDLALDSAEASNSNDIPEKPVISRPRSLSWRASPKTDSSASPRAQETLTPSAKRLDSEIIPSSASKTTLRPLSISNLSSLGAGTPVAQNMRLGDTVRKISPGSRKRRMYSEDEMNEARRNAMRVTMEETTQAQAIERQTFMREKTELEKKLRSEHSEVLELKSVLREYELTMQQMVAQGNSMANSHRTAVEIENSKLKGELLEVSDAFEKLKELYETSKRTVAVLENKETRLIEQHKDLKMNMVELQKWSNDLKANCEKKLAKAFESVTKSRASYMDKEAHASKAVSDLDRVRADLEQETANHSETAAALARVEAMLHAEQDARSSLDAALATAKESLTLVTAQRDQLKAEINLTKPKLDEALAEVDRLKDADKRAAETDRQLHTVVTESQALKVRAYDDMTRISALETQLEAKEEELKDLSSICEEAMSQLEQLDGKRGSS